MSETEFLNLADATLNKVQAMFETANDQDIVDVDCTRSGNVLEIEFLENGSKIIVNSQAAMQEMWVAARSGGFHYRYNGELWLNTRDHLELFATLSSLAEEQGGVAI